MTGVIYNAMLHHLMCGEIDFERDSFNVLLVTSDYRVSQRQHSVLADVSDDEVTGVGYSAGGMPVSVSVAADKQGNAIEFGGAEWLNSTIRARYAVYYRRAGGELIACVDFLKDVVSAKGAFTLSASTLRIEYA